MSRITTEQKTRFHNSIKQQQKKKNMLAESIRFLIIKPKNIFNNNLTVVVSRSYVKIICKISHSYEFSKIPFYNVPYNKYHSHILN